MENIIIIIFIFILNYVCMNMSIVFIHHFYFEKINSFIKTNFLPQLKNFMPTLYEPSYFFEINNTNPIIIDTNKYSDQNIYIIDKNNQIKNFYNYTINIQNNKDKLIIYHNFKEKKNFFLFF